MHIKHNKSRLYFIFAGFIFILIFYAARLSYIQVLKSPYLSKLARKQHNILLELKPERGDIFDKKLHRLAMDYKVYSVYAVPNKIRQENKKYTAEVLSEILDIKRDTLLNKLKKKKSFVWLKRKVKKDVSDALEKQDLEGIELIKEYKRFYPKGALASHVIGFAGLDGTGLEGIELAYDGYLKGASGWRRTVRDAKRRDILSRDVKFIPASQGLDIVLTIDEAIQHIAERELDDVYRKYNAKGASIIVMDPSTGDILAMANRPTFDLNNFSSYDIDARRNRAVTDVYEPGSVFKVITASLALEKKAVKLDQEFFCENGEYRIGGRILHDHRAYENLTFKEVIEKSSNIGVTKVAQILGKDELYRFITLFGFGQLTGIDMPGEVKGIVRPPQVWSAVSISAVPIGQEIAVTSIQLATAVSAIANGGYLIRPKIVREIRNKNGNVVRTFGTVKVRRVLSQKCSDTMKMILKGVIENGTGRNARLNEYTAAGKTGTAQKPDPDGGYSHTRFVSSFVGFAPADRPRITVLVSVDEPHPSYYGGTVAAPVFKNVAEDVLRYLKVEPNISGKSGSA